MKNVYISKYTDRKVSAQQCLCDLIMERIAAKAGEILPFKYWAVSKWLKTYKRQITAAGKLLREVDIVPVMAFLRSPKGRHIYSLGLHKQIIEGSKTFAINTNFILEQEMPEQVEIYENIEEIPDKEVIIKKTSWELLG